MQGVLIKGSEDVVVSGWSLVIHKVRRSHSGSYTCMASNNIGSATSKPTKIAVSCE